MKEASNILTNLCRNPGRLERPWPTYATETNFQVQQKGEGKNRDGANFAAEAPRYPLKKNTAVNLLYRKRGRSFAFEQCLPQQADEVGIGRRRKVTQHFRLGQVAGHVAVYRREEWAPLGVLLGDRFSELFLVDALNCATSKIKKRK